MTTRLMRVMGLMAVLAWPVMGANHYVKPNGTGNGSTWTAAADWDTIFNYSISAGDTIWVAGGTYTSGMKPNQSGNANAWIQVKRVLSDAESGSADGWSEGFISQVVVSSGGQCPINWWEPGYYASYVIFDGRTDSGIKLNFIAAAPSDGGCAIYARDRDTSIYTAPHHLTFTNIEIAGPLTANCQSEYAGELCGVVFNKSSYITLTHLRMHGGGRIGGYAEACNNIIWDHCLIYDAAALYSGNHNNILILSMTTPATIRYCELSGWETEGIVLWGGYTNNPPVVYIYGNIFRDPTHYVEAEDGWGTTPRVIEPSVNNNIPATDGYFKMFLYNNTFVECPDNIFFPRSLSQGGFVSGTVARNNLVVNSAGDTWNIPQHHTTYCDYTYADFATGESHTWSDASSSMFQAYGPAYSKCATITRNLRLASSAGAIDKGVEVVNVYDSGGTYHTFNEDADGNARGAGDGWDIGAYEYDGTPSTNPVPQLAAAVAGYVVGYPGLIETQTVAVANSGSGTLTVSNVLTDAGTNWVVLLTNTVAPSGGTNVPIRFYHDTPGEWTNELAVYTNGVSAGTVALAAETMAKLGESFRAIDGYLTSYYAQTTNTGYIYDPDNHQADFSGASAAYYWFHLTNSGHYRIRAEHRALDDSANSVWLNLGTYSAFPTNGDYYIWDMPTASVEVQTNFVSLRGTGTYDTNEFNPMVWSNLVGGTDYLLGVVAREPSVHLHHFELVPEHTNAPPNTDPPTIIVQPVNVSCGVGESATFSVTAVGSNLFYLWQWLGVPAIEGYTDSSMTITNAQLTNAGYYFCNVSNAYGNTNSWAASLTVTESGEPPTITASPNTTTNIVGVNHGYSVRATGTAPLSYQWYLNDAPIVGETSSAYKIDLLSTNDSGSYFAIVTNANGAATSAVAVLTVAWPPYITGQPANQTVIVSSNFTFTTTAGGYGTLAYQWRRNGTNLEPGGTWSAYSPWNYAAWRGAAGLYDCRVTNIAGSVTSSAAWLNVLTPDTPPLMLRVVIPARP